MTAADRVTGLVRALRAHGFGIGTGETVDAGLALEAVGFDDRERMRAALAATLLHGEDRRPVFDRVFDLYFPLVEALPGAEAHGRTGPEGDPPGAGSGDGDPAAGRSADTAD
ncbi:hypothetical protein ACWGI1_23055, partial [Streptomyces sp. NPDC054835]